MSPPQPQLIHLALSCLHPGEDNVRSMPASNADDEELKASIHAHGLLESLLVQATPNDGDAPHHAVIAGGRRLTALRALATDGTIPEDHPIPCQILTDPDTDHAELSLAENLVRSDMHPADQVTAFANLSRAGATVTEIAARFGVSEITVERRLRLGTIAPEILQAYRDNRLTLQHVKAFAVTSDQTRQLAAFNQLAQNERAFSDWHIRNLVLEGRVPATSPMATFVDDDAYLAAGGTIERDLFSNESNEGSWYSDPAVLRDTVMAQLETLATPLRSDWKWVDCIVELQWSDTAQLGNIRAIPADPTPDEALQLSKYETDIKTLEDADPETFSDDDFDQLNALQTALKHLSATIEARATYADDHRVYAGCIVSIDADGDLQVFKGLVRPNDAPAPAAPTTALAPNTAPASDPALTPASDPAAYQPPRITHTTPTVDPAATARKNASVGASLSDDLRSIRNTLVRPLLATNFNAAFDLAVYHAARDLLRSGYHPRTIDMTFKETSDRITQHASASDPLAAAAQQLKDVQARLNLAWLTDHTDPAASFEALRQLTLPQKKAIFAFCAARSLHGQLSFEHNARPEYESVVRTLAPTFAAHYRPDAPLFWNRVTKATMLDIGAQVLGKKWAKTRRNFKKDALVASLTEAFSADRPSWITKAQHTKALAWSPPGFAPPPAPSH